MTALANGADMNGRRILKQSQRFAESVSRQSGMISRFPVEEVAMRRYSHAANNVYLLEDHYPALVSGEQAYLYFLRQRGQSEVKYVGITIAPRSRHRAHLNTNIFGSLRKTQWISTVGKDVEMEVVAVMHYDEAVRAESALIKRFGYEQLVNSRTGGMTGRHRRSPEEIIADRLASYQRRIPDDIAYLELLIKKRDALVNQVANFETQLQQMQKFVKQHTEIGEQNEITN